MIIKVLKSKNGTNYTLTGYILNYEGLEINQFIVTFFSYTYLREYTPTENFAYEESGTF